MGCHRVPVVLWIFVLFLLAVCVFWQTRHELQRNAAEWEYFNLQQTWGIDARKSDPLVPDEIFSRQKESQIQASQKSLKTSKAQEKTAGKQTNVIIISQGRSGSTFLGEIFNQHPEVLYFFEPFRVLELVDRFDTFIGPPSRRYNDLATMFMGELLDCNIKASEYFTYFSRPGHFRFSSNALRTPPFCKPEAKTKTLQETMKNNLCINIVPSTLNKVCREQYRITAVKILEHRIMGKKIASLKPLFETEAYSGKIVYLVRDPRAVISSMYRGAWMSYVKKGKLTFHPIKSVEFLAYVQRICRQMQENLRLVRDPPNWLKGRFKLLRYEDLVLEPVKVTEELFDFVDLSLPREMRQWLYNRTHFTDTSLDGKEGVFSTRRNSTISLRKWRLRTSQEMIKIVENECSDVMVTMGYLHSYGSPEILSRVDIPLVTRNFAQKWKKR